MHRLKLGKNAKFRFLRRFGGSVCSHENMSCKIVGQILS